MPVRRCTHVSMGSQMKETSPNALLMQMKIRGHKTSIALWIGILVGVGCARAGGTKAHVRVMKPTPSAQRGSAAHQNSDTERVTPKVWELTALATSKGPSVAS